MLVIDSANPINRHHSLNANLVAEWCAVPPFYGGQLISLANPGIFSGTLTNGASFAGPMGRPGGLGSVLFDGSDDNISVVHNNELNIGSGDWTCSAWVRRNDGGTGNGWISMKRSGNDFWGLRLNSGANALCHIRTATGPQNLIATSSSNSVLNLAWTYVAAVKLGTTAQMYVNGVASGGLATNASIGSQSNTANLLIGSQLSAEFLAGNLDDVSIFDRALSASEVRELYLDSMRERKERWNYIDDAVAFGSAAPGGLSIPIAAYHYNHHLGSMAG